MIFHSITELLAFILGIVLFALQFLLFKYKVARASLILEGLLALVPVLGACSELVLIIIRSLTVCLPDEADNDYSSWIFGPAAVDSKLTRWLFNNLKWKRYDERIAKEKQE